MIHWCPVKFDSYPLCRFRNIERERWFSKNHNRSFRSEQRYYHLISFRSEPLQRTVNQRSRMTSHTRPRRNIRNSDDTSQVVNKGFHILPVYKLKEENKISCLVNPMAERKNKQNRGIFTLYLPLDKNFSFVFSSQP